MSTNWYMNPLRPGGTNSVPTPSTAGSPIDTAANMVDDVLGSVAAASATNKVLTKVTATYYILTFDYNSIPYVYEVSARDWS